MFLDVLASLEEPIVIHSLTIVYSNVFLKATYLDPFLASQLDYPLRHLSNVSRHVSNEDIYQMSQDIHKMSRDIHKMSQTNTSNFPIFTLIFRLYCFPTHPSMSSRLSIAIARAISSMVRSAISSLRKM